MIYKKSEKYNFKAIQDRIMGPNPIKLTEELMQNHNIPKSALVMDLGSGQGVTSVFLAKEYGFRIVAADLWSDPTDNMNFFKKMGLDSDRVVPIHADAEALPFAHGFFDAVISTDSYNYFGRSKDYLGTKLLPFVKKGGLIYIAVPGMKRDMHDNLPPELLLSWTPEQLDYIHDADYWRRMVEGTPGAEVISVFEMESNEEVWEDWISCNNEYAASDRKAIEMGACKYLNFIGMVILKA